MDYEGTIIKESLKSPGILKTLPVISTRVEPITPEHQTPWLTQWTLHTVNIPLDQAGPVAERLSHEIETTHQAWFIDFKNDTIHYIIFPGKVFEIDRAQPEQYRAAKQYGLNLGIPGYQLIDPSGLAPDVQ